MEIFKIVVMVLSGLLLSLVGIMRLNNPIKAYSKNSGIKLENDTDLLNEIRGISAVQLLGGITILLGILIPKIAIVSFTAATSIFVGFAIGRLLSQATDGKPNKQLISGLFFELVLGTANAFFLAGLLT